jgi:hypothetical protein
VIEGPRETQKILLRAAEILEGGWCRGAYAVSGLPGLGLCQVSLGTAQPGVDRFCLTGAILKAVQEHEGIEVRPREGVSGFLAMHPLATAAFGAMHGVLGEPLTAWNDRFCLSGDEAVGKVREAAHALDR